VVVDNFNFKGIVFMPFETNAPLVVNTDSVLAGPLSAQFFQPIGGWYAQVIEVEGPVQHSEFSKSGFLYIFRKLFGSFSVEDVFRLSVFKRPYHDAAILNIFVFFVKQK
jgi:hypothetical protein